MRHPTRRTGLASGWSRRAPLLALALLPLMAACDASARLGAPRTGYSTDGSQQPAIIDPALVGTWQRTLLLDGRAGDFVQSRTTWTFRFDGTATRIVEVVDFGRGFSDRLVSHARWRVADHVVVIDWRAPSSGTLRLPYRVSLDRATALLGNDLYVRVR